MKKSFEQILEEARLLDLRRQAQIQSQIEIINRLSGGATPARELKRLASELADAQVEKDEAQRQLEELRKGQGTAYTLGET